MHTHLKLLSLLAVLVVLQRSHLATAAAVHDVAVSVRSVRSIMYRGIQVSIFQHATKPGRYFFQPLSFYDQRSMRLSNQRLHLDVYMWTRDFVRLVESYFPLAESVELMPLTQVRLAWSVQAKHWLGDDFNKTWSILGDWRDADKPQMRTTYSIACKTSANCQELEAALNNSELAVASIFDLQYRVPFMDSRNTTVLITSQHLQRSPNYKQVEQFVELNSKSQVFVPAETVDAIVEETLAEAITQLQQRQRMEVAELSPGFHKSAFARLQQRLRSDAVTAMTGREWKEFTFWPPSSRNLRPDRLAMAFNTLFTAASGEDGSQSLNSLIVARPNALEVLENAAGSLPQTAANKIGDAIREQRASRRPLTAARLQELAQSLNSFAEWSDQERKFVLPKHCLMFRLSPNQLKAHGVLFLQQAEVLLRVSQHSDELLPLGSDASEDYSEEWLPSQLSIAQQQIKGVRQNLTAQQQEITQLRQQLEDWIEVFAPGGGGGRGSHRGSAQLRTSQQVGDVSSSQQLQMLQLQIKELRQVVNGSKWQTKFADKFCFLADRVDPQSGYCRSINYVIPRKSLRYSPIFDRRVRYRANQIGANYFQQISHKFFKFNLRICCIT